MFGLDRVQREIRHRKGNGCVALEHVLSYLMILFKLSAITRRIFFEHLINYDMPSDEATHMCKNPLEGTPYPHERRDLKTHTVMEKSVLR
jgi:hypothetical protein